MGGLYMKTFYWDDKNIRKQLGAGLRALSTLKITEQWTLSG